MNSDSGMTLRDSQYRQSLITEPRLVAGTFIKRERGGRGREREKREKRRRGRRRTDRYTWKGDRSGAGSRLFGTSAYRVATVICFRNI